MKKKIVSFLAHRSLESRGVIDSKIEILGIMTTFSIAWRFGSMTQIELEIESISSRVTMLVSSIRVGSRCWYRVFGPGQKVGTDSRPGGQSNSNVSLFSSIDFILLRVSPSLEKARRRVFNSNFQILEGKNYNRL
jgi:hypothetical protein